MQMQRILPDQLENFTIATNDLFFSRSPHAFQAFGQGPRACLGMRFALLELKVAVAMIVRHMVSLPSTSVTTTTTSITITNAITITITIAKAMTIIILRLGT